MLPLGTFEGPGGAASRGVSGKQAEGVGWGPLGWGLPMGPFFHAGTSGLSCWASGAQASITECPLPQAVRAEALRRHRELRGGAIAPPWLPRCLLGGGLPLPHPRGQVFRESKYPSPSRVCAHPGRPCLPCWGLVCRAWAQSVMRGHGGERGARGPVVAEGPGRGCPGQE